MSRLGALSAGRFLRSLDCFGRFKHRHLDARSWSRLADDLTNTVTTLGCAHADRHHPSRVAAWSTRRSAGRCGGSPQDAAFYPDSGCLSPLPASVFYAFQRDQSVAAADSYICLGAGAAMNAPAWQATGSETVPRVELPAAVALTGMGLNVARAVGPALGGIVIAASGPWACFC